MHRAPFTLTPASIAAASPATTHYYHCHTTPTPYTTHTCHTCRTYTYSTCHHYARLYTHYCYLPRLPLLPPSHTHTPHAATGIRLPSNCLPLPATLPPAYCYHCCYTHACLHTTPHLHMLPPFPPPPPPAFWFICGIHTFVYGDGDGSALINVCWLTSPHHLPHYQLRWRPAVFWWRDGSCNNSILLYVTAPGAAVARARWPYRTFPLPSPLPSPDVRP